MHTIGDMKCTAMPRDFNSRCMRFTRFNSVPTSQREPGADPDTVFRMNSVEPMRSDFSQTSYEHSG